MDYRIVSRICRGHDFYEGVRAVIVDKDNRPHWSPPPSRAEVDAYFAPLGDERAHVSGAAPHEIHHAPEPRRRGRARRSIAGADQRRRSHVGDFAAGLGDALIWYMRTLAWVWMAKGLFHWAIILGALPSLGQFTTMALPLQATIVAFACLDLLAAIGLWLAAAWGGAIWLLVRGGRGRVSDPESARGCDRLWRRSAERRAGGRLFPVELAGGARTRLTAEASHEAPSSTFFACRSPWRRLRLVNVNKAFDSIEIYQCMQNLGFILTLKLVFMRFRYSSTS